MNDPLQIAIDGPAGSGKSTVAARLATQLGFVHLDTGAMYRAVTLLCLRNDLVPDDGAGLAALLREAQLSFDPEGRLWLGDEDISREIRTESITATVSQVSAHPQVRAEMVRRQRRIGWDARPGAVMEGRDIGSVVLPLARVKIYLEATPEERARRRVEQMGLDPEAIPRIQAEMEARDIQDSTREESPLLVSPDAHLVDTTGQDVEQVVAACLELVEATRAQDAPASEPVPGFQKRHYRVAYRGLRGFNRWVLGLQIYGGAGQDRDPSLIYASNHLSWWDPTVVGASISREVWFMAKKELFLWPFSLLISNFNAMPIQRGRFDRSAFDRSNELLHTGRNILVFPEGTRRKPGNPGPVKKGLGILSLRSGVPYVPVFVRGTDSILKAIFRRKPLEVWIGRPVTLHAADHLLQTLPETEVQIRVGALYLAQLRAFWDRSQQRREG